MITLLPDHTPALTVLQPFGSFVEEGTKLIETRVWKTDYRGDLLICAGASPHTGSCLGVFEMCQSKELIAFPVKGDFKYKDYSADFYNIFRKYPLGVALCLVELHDCRTMTKDDEIPARCRIYPGAWAWCFRNVRPVKHVPIKGKQRIFHVPNTLITIL